MIRTKKIKSISSRIPKDNSTDVYVNVLTWHDKNHKYGSEYYTLSPYFLKTDGNELNHNNGGIIFENFWQGSKVWKKVSDVDLWAHFSLRGKPQHLWWNYKCCNGLGYENHIINDEIQSEYYNWRNDIFSCQKPVRYPTGYNQKDPPEFSLLIDKNGVETRLDYIKARKLIYFNEYCRLIENLPEFKKLCNHLNEGKNIIICEIDLPDNEILDIEKINNLLDDPKIKFGHGLCLAWKILDMKSKQNLL